MLPLPLNEVVFIRRALTGGVEVAGSNPVSPTGESSGELGSSGLFFFSGSACRIAIPPLPSMATCSRPVTTSATSKAFGSRTGRRVIELGLGSIGGDDASSRRKFQCILIAL